MPMAYAISGRCTGNEDNAANTGGRSTACSPCKCMGVCCKRDGKELALRAYLR
ncbi:hypothetical protein L226DRAFT_536839 [Lentinus tigrinus ALCF2SS1-7]|uniref:Uncharacterized protein n=1 Tax=Lentinus tigrinus ALCF2SS1-6 TaxID=1328759 RepID=A0A5C2SA49_9APHY|nr:hypothetical protein L227DRAFT_577235 [Lentinus tigrinus ALCF2SS1-6]RPD73005.1 hypothetical protein L226DRAFT_536839 [Lentinus tigrinus ALCF2SS1-7]